MLFEDDSILDTNSAISEEDVVSLLEKFKHSTEDLPLEKETALLQNQNALGYFKFNIDQYCELHTLILGRFEDASQFLSFMNSESIFPKSIRDGEQFHHNFLQIVMPALVGACSKFREDERVFEAASGLIGKCVFSSKEFTCYFKDLFERNKCPEKHHLCKSLLKYCASLPTDLEISRASLKLIFNAFAQSFRNFSHVYRMLIILLEIVGFEVREHFNCGKIKYLASEPSLNSSLRILNAFLDVIIKTARFELHYEINKVTFSDFMKNFAKSVMALSRAPNACCYKIFVKIIDINPLIITSIIAETLVYIMLADNSECRQEYEELMIKIFGVYRQLHRIQSLISKMIPTLQTALEKRESNETCYAFRGNLDLEFNENTSYNIDNIFPTSISDFFTSCVIGLASWQAINLFKTLLYHLDKAVEGIEEVKEENIYIEILSTLTSWLLLSIRVAEHTIAEKTLVKFVQGLDELKATLGKFGTVLLQKEHVWKLF